MPAVGLDRVSRVLGYTLQTADFSNVTPNLPQRIAILSEANTANQSGLDTTPFQITTAQSAGDKYGYGSPIHMMARILFPQSGDGVGGIPVWVYPQEEPGGATSKQITITPTGVATGNGTHTLVIAGRSGVDSEFYDVNIVTGDTTAEITDKIADAINNVLGCPVVGTSDTYEVVAESKWAGLTANELTITVDTSAGDLGISYAITSTQSGSGTPSIASALSAFGNAWNTLVLNGYGTESNIVSALEAFNGVPSNTAPTGRYSGLVFKPFVALTGSVADDDTTFTDAKKSEITIALCPAPLSKGIHFEAAANMAALYAPIAQNTPAQNVGGLTYPDMPTPTSIGSMAIYTNRDAFVKKGSSTVDLVDGNYKVADFVTTWHPVGELAPLFRYVRDLTLDFNVKFGEQLIIETNVQGRIIVNDADIVSAANTIKPKELKGLIIDYADQLGARGLIADVAFMKSNISVSISTTNPKRFDIAFKYKRSGTAEIVSTTATAGFNFGS